MSNFQTLVFFGENVPQHCRLEGGGGIGREVGGSGGRWEGLGGDWEGEGSGREGRRVFFNNYRKLVFKKAV